jgi:hypothetical protein
LVFYLFLPAFLSMELKRSEHETEYKTLSIHWKVEAVRILVFWDVTLCRWVISEVSKERNAFILKIHPEDEVL